ncbi:MAG: aldehyde dehydrogenase family protein, partial [Parvibaculales bacterium]
MTQEKQLINGKWIEAPAGAEHIGQAAQAAEEAFESYRLQSEGERAAFLRAIADEIEARAEAITVAACAETSLPQARIEGERGRTTGQLRLFADYIESGEHLDVCYEGALPDREPLPRPSLYRIMRPVGPVVVFGA